jgi:hypothetical protein
MRADVRSILDDVLSNLEDVLSILEKEMVAQQGSRQETLSGKFDAQYAPAKVLAQISAALPIQREIRRPLPEPNHKPIDALDEWSRWERDILAFEAKP